jgi:hypothetical protein
MPPSNTRQQRQIRSTSGTAATDDDSGFRRGFLLASSSSLDNAPRATTHSVSPKDKTNNNSSGLRRGFLLSRTLPSSPPPVAANSRDEDASVPPKALNATTSTNDSIGKMDSTARVANQTVSSGKITSPELLTLETTSNTKPSRHNGEPWWVVAAPPPYHDIAGCHHHHHHHLATERTDRPRMILSVIDDDNDDHGKQSANAALAATETTEDSDSARGTSTVPVSLLFGNVVATNNEMEERKSVESSGLLLTEVTSSATRQESPRPNDFGAVPAGNTKVVRTDANHYNSELGAAKNVNDPETAAGGAKESLSPLRLPSPETGTNPDPIRAGRQSIESTLRQLRRARKRTWRNIGQGLVLEDRTNDETSLALWQAMVDAILDRVNPAGGGGGPTKMASTELWLGEYLLKRWLSMTTDESTPWSHFLFVSHGTTDPSVTANNSNSLDLKVQRYRQLAVVNLFHVWLGRCCEQHEHPNHEITLPQVCSLVHFVLPRLVVDALISTTKRVKGIVGAEANMSPPRKLQQPTVLEQKMLEVVYRIVVLAANTIVWANNAKPDDMVDTVKVAPMADSLWSQSPMLQELLEAQQSWLSCSGTESIPAQPDDPVARSNIRTMCRAAIFADWIQLYYDCRDGNVQTWCQLLLGQQLGRDPPGSFGYSVAGVGQELTKSDIVSWSTLNHESRPAADSYQLGRTRSYIRGLLAWISRRSKHWSSLETNDVLSLSWWILEAMTVFKSRLVNSLSLVAL